MRILYLITARAGSKGLPGKNIKMLGDKPLIQYSIDFALHNMNPEDVLCVSTNDDGILELLTKLEIEIPFKRPEELASDAAGSYEVIMHALKHYEVNDIVFDAVLLLQPTSPFRHQDDIANLFETYDEECDMVVSVKKSKESPYYTIFEENGDNFLERSKKSSFTRRQDCPDVFTYNGSMYLMRVDSLKKTPISEFEKIKKIIMPEERSIDIDTMADWVLTEYYLNIQ
ncbi:acylneuraminate cytidylyltransferase family protein [Flavobacterium sp. ZT3R18]|uniref:acylneuraminate cytidylyltransferase family protein n=1 Tax=Flavobacterium sp. ZT3R18 TaxID=2594429 RepID=UPI001179C691|nr:acylneuraminate cytidylyltransferase family protein [Flavobacterium sp. ZT3R18]TRX34800.1 acylneuraminate cytidylyltransferase family protein [Flavobacterium sp. ZT3R18]